MLDKKFNKIHIWLALCFTNVEQTNFNDMENKFMLELLNYLEMDKTCMISAYYSIEYLNREST